MSSEWVYRIQLMCLDKSVDVREGERGKRAGIHTSNLLHLALMHTIPELGVRCPIRTNRASLDPF